MWTAMVFLMSPLVPGRSHPVLHRAVSVPAGAPTPPFVHMLSDLHECLPFRPIPAHSLSFSPSAAFLTPAPFSAPDV